MAPTRVLYISGSIGLGHAGRDLATANELRRLNPSIEIAWLAGDPARRLRQLRFEGGAGRLETCGGRVRRGERRVPLRPARGYVPRLYEHFAASDVAVVQGGGTTTLELTALRRPFLYFPLENHFEQNLVVAERVARHRAGKRMRYSQTTPQQLADAIVALIGTEATWPPIPTDGARGAAELINELSRTTSRGLDHPSDEPRSLMTGANATRKGRWGA